MTTSLKSQLRTTANGQRLATALRLAMSGDDQELHLIGYSHGAKVATVASALLDPKPRHLSLLDSPDSVVPIIGGALNDLSSYLRLLARGGSDPGTFVDNYPSHFGVQYGKSTGLGGVVDVTLDPSTHPTANPPSDHAYAWAWYLETARRPDLGVGYAWSPLRAGHTHPRETQLRQPRESGLGSFELERNDDILPGTTGARLRSRARRLEPSRVLSTRATAKARVLFWRRSGDLWASTLVEWRYGPDDAAVVVSANRTERARSVKGWSSDPDRLVHIPLGGSRFGPMVVRIDLESSGPAEVVLHPAKAVHGFALPVGSEMQAWIRPLFIAFATFGAAVMARGLAGVVKGLRGRPCAS